MDTEFFIVNMVIVLVFTIAAITILKKKGYAAFAGVFVGMLIISFSSTIAMYGIGNTWGIASIIGKALAVLLALCVPLVLASAPIVGFNNKSIRPIYVGSISLLLGYIGVASVPVLGIMLVCTFTGDCL